jgi:hypothetical protein
MLSGLPGVPGVVVNLYHRALYVLRNYRYLAALERESEASLRLRRNRSRLRGKAVFTGVIGHSFKAR